MLASSDSNLFFFILINLTNFACKEYPFARQYVYLLNDMVAFIIKTSLESALLYFKQKNRLLNEFCLVQNAPPPYEHLVLIADTNSGLPLALHLCYVLIHTLILVLATLFMALVLVLMHPHLLED